MRTRVIIYEYEIFSFSFFWWVEISSMLLDFLAEEEVISLCVECLSLIHI